jgi:hypothetical protein
MGWNTFWANFPQTQQVTLRGEMVIVAVCIKIRRLVRIPSGYKRDGDLIAILFFKYHSHCVKGSLPEIQMH